MRQTLSQSRSVRERGGWVNGCSQGIEWVWVYVDIRVVPGRSSAARAALRGASPLPHLLQRGHACGRGVAGLGARLETSGAAAMPTQKSSQPNKADNHGLSGSARCNKCGSGLAPRSAARAALDFSTIIKPKAYTRTHPNISPFRPALSSIRTGCCYAAGYGLPVASRQRSCGRRWKNAAPRRNHRTARSG